MAAAATFGVLAQETRLRLLRVLASHGASGMAAGDIARALAVAPSTLSFHLAALEQAGLVRSTRHGRRIIYAIRFAGLRELLVFLGEACGASRPELGCEIGQLLSFPESANEGPMEAAFNVLFLCTRNSARSIIAEALLERVGRGRFNSYSAGTEPAGAPMPEVIERLAALGHDVGRLRSKSWLELAGPQAPRMDFVITLCDVPEGEVCPDLGTRAITAAWPFPDPAKFTGSPVERTAMLNGLYGMMRRRLEAFVSLPFDTLDRMALKARLEALGDSGRMAI